MNTKTVRWGILGVAKINDRLLPSFAKASGLELRGIASRSAEKAQAAAAAAGIPRAYGSYEALLDDPDIDAVYVPLPNHLHAEWTRKAADRGKHVLCEKPLTPAAPDAQALVDYCRARNVKLMDGFMWPHHPRTAEIAGRVRGGAIGRVRHVAGAFTFRLPMDAQNIRLQAAAGGGSLLDVGCYPVYGIRWAFGEEPVRAWATARYEHGCDVAMNGVLWFADGRTATFDCGFTAPLRQWLEITGETGVLTVPEMWVPPAARATYAVRPDGAAGQEFAVEGADQIRHMLENFSRAVAEDQPVRPDPQEAVLTLRVLDALAASARSGQAVEIR